MTDEARAVERRIKAWLIVFLVGLVLSGATAFPLVTEIRWADGVLRAWGVDNWLPSLTDWIARVRVGLEETDAEHPFILYGTDWLAFAHLVIAVAFWGPYRDPVRNVWIIQWGLIACAGIIPLALVCGPIRGIPWGWSLVDMSFGVFGAIPLWIVLRQIRRLEALRPPAGSPA